jgi:hypothetical protein
MKLLIPERISFKGPDPPPADWDLTEGISLAAESVVTSKHASKKKDEVPPPEIPKSPEVEAAEKMVRRFMKTFMTNLLQLQTDLNEYRGYT